MTEHDWQPIAPPEDNGIMCTVCFQCKCCSDWTDECPGEPAYEDVIAKGPTEEAREMIRQWRESKAPVEYADPEEVRKVAEKIVNENQELLRRLADK